MPPSAHALALTLEEGALRLLLWLDHYPLQRAQDLILAAAPWEKRTTVYRHLADLERAHLIEELYAGITAKKRLYHLSPLGCAVCDYLAAQEDHPQAEKQARWERWTRQDVGAVVREERGKLVRLLPRLPLWVLLQDTIEGLVRNADRALARQGRHAQLIQWNWMREYRHPFVSREQTLRVQAEAALTFCLRFPQAPGAPPSSSPLATEEVWYTMMVLHCPLDEPRLMRQRLDRLLRWRESAERMGVYSHMPPVVILATTERQAEWWHQLAAQTAARLRVDPLVGAVAVLPPEPVSCWHLPFRRLDTREMCHLHNLLSPLPVPALPELLASRGDARRSKAARETRAARTVLTLPLPSRLRGRSFLPGKARVPVRRGSPPQQRTPGDYCALSVALTARQWEILRLCFAHPLLSREDLTHFLLLSRTTTTLLLGDLARLGYLASTSTLVGERWQVSESGLRLLARLVGCQVHRFIRFPVEAGHPLVQRGVRGLMHQIRHTAGVYAFFAQVSEALAHQPDTRLLWWETGVLSERHFAFRERIYRFRPDAFASVQIGQRPMRFWLEWDRGTMTAKNYQVKFTTYAMYLASREWARSSPLLPALLCVAPDIGQESQLTKAARRCVLQAPSGWCVYSTTASLLMTQGVLGPIWRLVTAQEPTEPPAALERQRLFTAEAPDRGSEPL
ncbi:MAG TPA: replication-relaxation family protein [Acidobacteriaceae bacterium]|nr:replication-relaxation family protein [Acidobacteriaceae bacterium]